jgi:hypothetical protein
MLSREKEPIHHNISIFHIYIYIYIYIRLRKQELRKIKIIFYKTDSQK